MELIPGVGVDDRTVGVVDTGGFDASKSSMVKR
jgi:hypothetical protein